MRLFFALLLSSTAALQATEPLSIQVNRAVLGEKVSVQVFNNTSNPISLWQTGNSWGWANWTFEFIGGNEMRLFVRKPDEGFTVNIPNPVTIPANGSREFSFDLKDGTWVSHAIPIYPTYPDLGFEKNAVVGCFAILSIPTSPEATEYRICTGTFISHFH